ncbi:MAG: 2-phospho-L-lactate guanylyltransferase [Methanoregulaceae archaeon]
MCPVAVIPFKPVNPKTRLSALLSQEERESFARAMLDDVLAAARDADLRPVILATEPFDTEEIVVTLEEDGLSGSLNEYLGCCLDRVVILMADLPLADAASLRRVAGTTANIAIVPGRGGGTNVIYLPEPDKFKVDYYGGSFAKHRKIAEDAGLTCEVVDSFRLHTDIDEEDDLPEILIHGTGKSRKFLEDLGFTLSAENGRVRVVRN